MMMSSSLPAALLLAFGVTLPIVAQGPAAPRTLGKPTATFDAEFSRVAGLVELPDGRVVIVDSKDHLLFLGDPATGRVKQLGRQGAGPNEYRAIYQVSRVRGDTLLVHDTGNNRLLRVAPDGTLAGSIPFPQPTGQEIRVGMAPARGADALGRLYWDHPEVNRGENGQFKRQLESKVFRWLPGSDSIELVATMADHAPSMHTKRYFPFAERDAFVVAPSGRVGVLRAATYRLDWIERGVVVASGPPIGFTRLSVTARDRERYRADRAANPVTASFRGPPGQRAAPTEEALREMRSAYPDDMFPQFLPPFVEQGAHLSPSGEIWVMRSTTTGLGEQPVDLLTPDGRRRETLALAANTRIVSLARRGIYVVREEEDGIQRILRYAWPTGLR
ncbi:MAG: hypothetical protein SFU84_15095 [Gemmatimonadales bacterium]|nr:hypothetical protein [Gemmatimonadales bacterium]